jgi:hypothetical protein
MHLAQKRVGLLAAGCNKKRIVNLIVRMNAVAHHAHEKRLVGERREVPLLQHPKIQADRQHGRRSEMRASRSLEGKKRTKKQEENKKRTRRDALAQQRGQHRALRNARRLDKCPAADGDLDSET